MFSSYGYCRRPAVSPRTSGSYGPSDRAANVLKSPTAISVKMHGERIPRSLLRG